MAESVEKNRERLLRALDELAASPKRVIKLTGDGYFYWYFPDVSFDLKLLKHRLDSDKMPDEVPCGTGGCALGVMGAIDLVDITSLALYSWNSRLIVAPKVASVLGIPEDLVRDIFYNEHGFWQLGDMVDVTAGMVAEALRLEFEEYPVGG